LLDTVTTIDIKSESQGLSDVDRQNKLDCETALRKLMPGKEIKGKKGGGLESAILGDHTKLLDDFHRLLPRPGPTN
jgi:hypothetical protein